MSDYKYLIVGGGMTAEAAVRGIREVDGAGSIGLISSERHPPYTRPYLSKGLWTGAKTMADIWRAPEGVAAEVLLGRTVTSLDPAARQVVDDRGASYGYERLLLATGASPIRLPFGGEAINYFRTLDDYEQLRADAGAGKRVAIIGGGFIGSEIAAALAMNEAEVTMLFPETGICARIFPGELSLFLNDFYREKGVAVLAETLVTGLESGPDGHTIQTDSGQAIAADVVVAGIGVRPDVALAQAAGLEVDNGIVVDEHLLTSQPAVYAAGDVAAFYNPALGKRVRVEHEDNALMMGRAAGQNMAGEPAPYHHQPYFYSDMFELGYEAVGELDSRLDTVVDWQEPYRKGVVYYLRDGRPTGVLLWDIWGQVDAGRALIAEGRNYGEAELKGRLPE